MNLSQLPELREFRDRRARKIRNRRGGAYLDAVDEANVAARAVYAEAVRGARGGKPTRAAIGRAITEARAGRVAVPARGAGRSLRGRRTR